MDQHKTERVTIDGEEVDIHCLMVGFIKWLNKLLTVKTNFCCEGGGKTSPYIQFLCRHDDDLRKVLFAIKPCFDTRLQEMFGERLPLSLERGDRFVFATCEVEMDMYVVSKRYCLYFGSKSMLIELNKYMGFAPI